MGVRSASSAQHSVLVTHSHAITIRGREGYSCCAVISSSCWNKHTAVFQSFGSHTSASDQTFSVCSKLTFFTKHFGNGVVYPACPVFHQFIPNIICHKFWIHVLCSTWVVYSSTCHHRRRWISLWKGTKKCYILWKLTPLLTFFTGMLSVYCHHNWLFSSLFLCNRWGRLWRVYHYVFITLGLKSRSKILRLMSTNTNIYS